MLTTSTPSADSDPGRLLHHSIDLQLDVARDYGRERLTSPALVRAWFADHDEEADGCISTRHPDLALKLEAILEIVIVVGQRAGLEVDGTIFRVGLFRELVRAHPRYNAVTRPNVVCQRQQV